MRQAVVTRETKETNIQTTLFIEGSGQSTIDTGNDFLNHMLEVFTYHGRFDIKLRCKDELIMDVHHAAEDSGIALGRAFDRALGDRRGIRRYGNFVMPMDEALVLTALDISGRAHLNYDISLNTEKIGTMDVQSIEAFFEGFVRSLGLTLHFKQLAGRNSHHIIEACFKGLARALSEAVENDPKFGTEIPSSKGIIV